MLRGGRLRTAVPHRLRARQMMCTSTRSRLIHSHANRQADTFNVVSASLTFSVPRRIGIKASACRTRILQRTSSRTCQRGRMSPLRTAVLCVQEMRGARAGARGAVASAEPSLQSARGKSLLAAPQEPRARPLRRPRCQNDTSLTQIAPRLGQRAGTVPTSCSLSLMIRMSRSGDGHR